MFLGHPAGCECACEGISGEHKPGALRLTCLWPLLTWPPLCREGHCVLLLRGAGSWATGSQGSHRSGGFGVLR